MFDALARPRMNSNPVKSKDRVFLVDDHPLVRGDRGRLGDPGESEVDRRVAATGRGDRASNWGGLAKGTSLKKVQQTEVRSSS